MKVFSPREGEPVTPQTTGNRFRIAATAILVVLSLVGSAHASDAKKKKVKPTCHLVTDATDDAKNGANTNNPSLDITSADIVTNKTQLTAVIRVAKLTTGFDSLAPSGRMWQLTMAIPGANAGQVTVGVSDGPFGARDVDGIGGKVRLDAATNSVYVTESLSALAGAFHAHIAYRKTRITQFFATSAAMVQEPDVAHLKMLNLPGGGGDIAPDGGVSPSAYLAGMPSCLKVGS
jgi:hypothetical protein